MSGGIASVPPTPTALKLIRGNPGKRPLNHDEPKPKVSLPPPPPHLTHFPLAVTNWELEGGLLLRLGVMTEADWGVLAVRCYLYSEMVAMMEEIRARGRMIESVKITGGGKRPEKVEVVVTKNPLVAQLESAMSEYRRVGVLLGLDPSSRTRVKVNKGTDKGEFDEFFDK